VYAELAKEGVPLPFGNRFWASNWPTGKSPLPGLIIHLIPSVSFSALLRWLHQFEQICLSQVIIIIAPPPAVVYPFILDVEGYPQQIINFFIVIVRTQSSYSYSFIFRLPLPQGLFWLRYKKPNAIRPFKGKSAASPLSRVPG
jgi:L-type amino acid transporter 9